MASLLSAVAIVVLVMLGSYRLLTEAGFDDGFCQLVAGTVTAAIPYLHEALEKRSLRISPLLRPLGLGEAGRYFLDWKVAGVYGAAAFIAISCALSILAVYLTFGARGGTELRIPVPLVQPLVQGLTVVLAATIAAVAFWIGRRAGDRGPLALTLAVLPAVVLIHLFEVAWYTQDQHVILFNEDAPALADMFDAEEWLYIAVGALLVLAPFYCLGRRGSDAAFFRFVFKRLAPDTREAAIRLIEEEARKQAQARPAAPPQPAGAAAHPGRRAWIALAASLAVPAAILTAGVLRDSAPLLVLSGHAGFVWLAVAAALAALRRFDPRDWVPIGPEAARSHPLYGLGPWLWILLALPIASSLGLAAGNLMAFVAGLQQSVQAEYPGLPDALAARMAWRRAAGWPAAAMLAGVLSYHAGAILLFAAALIALARRRGAFRLLYLAGLALYGFAGMATWALLFALLPAEAVIAQSGGEAAAAAYDIAIQVAIAAALGAYVLRSRRLNLNLFGRVPGADPAAGAAPADARRRARWEVRRTVAAFARLPRATRDSVIDLLLGEVADREAAAERKAESGAAAAHLPAAAAH